MFEQRVPIAALGLWLREAVLCGCGFMYCSVLRECPKCSSDSGVSLPKLLDRLFTMEVSGGRTRRAQDSPKDR